MRPSTTTEIKAAGSVLGCGLFVFLIQATLFLGAVAAAAYMVKWVMAK